MFILTEKLKLNLFVMNKTIRLTRDIHYFVRGMLSWEDSIRLLDEIIDDPEWIDFLFIDILLYQVALKKQDDVQRVAEQKIYRRRNGKNQSFPG